MSIEAIKKSIKHWQNNLNCKNLNFVDTLASSCPLCRVYLSAGCPRCPVKLKTGLPDCRNTPYEEACRALGIAIRRKTMTGKYDWQLNKKWKQACRKEIEFLKSLLPED